jgi:hypothetical protein
MTADAPAPLVFPIAKAQNDPINNVPIINRLGQAYESRLFERCSAGLLRPPGEWQIAKPPRLGRNET